jgi:hypothetical protein
MTVADRGKTRTRTRVHRVLLTQTNEADWTKKHNVPATAPKYDYYTVASQADCRFTTMTFRASNPARSKAASHRA